MSLYGKLKEYGESGVYAFHMPGHKRLMGKFKNPFLIDITEIEGFDDLHHPEQGGILTEARQRAARLFRASETHFLINGSTAGMLSAISGCTSRDGKILMARNCHRCAYHGAALRNLEIRYLYPQMVEKLGINGGISPADVENALDREPDIQTVVLTSPTYDGICSDIKQIAELCHRRGVPLIVDQAHGAHFPFSEYFPGDAVRDGADVVVHSVHKTLPSLTQTALLHLNGDLADREKIRHYLSVYQSSSPSYPLLASVDSCMELLEAEGSELFCRHTELLSRFREECRDLKKLGLAEKELESSPSVFDFDRSKLLIFSGNTSITGTELSAVLREKYKLEMEMASLGYVLGITSVADSREGFCRLLEALHEIDAGLEKRVLPVERPGLYRSRTRVSVGDAEEGEKESIPIWDSEGRIAGGYVYVYPPGIPILAPGEEISAEVLEQLKIYGHSGLEIQGLSKTHEIKVLK